MACAVDVRCPEGREPVGDACACPTGKLERDGACVDGPGGPESGSAPTEGGEVDEPVDREPPDSRHPSAFSDAGVEAPPDAAAHEPVRDGAAHPAPDDPPPSSAPVPVATPEGPRPAPGRPSATMGTACPTSCGPAGCDAAGGCLRRGPCGDGVLDVGEECDDGNVRNDDACIACKRSACNGEFIERGVEECEVGVAGWTEASCGKTTCKRKLYTPCETDADCPGAPLDVLCYNGVCSPHTCAAGAKTCAYPPCPSIPGHETFISFASCALLCNESQPCPVGLTCDIENQMCVHC